MKKILGAAALALLMSTSANAVTLGGLDWDTSNAGNLTLSPTVPGGNQPQNQPCLICGANQPQQLDGFGYNWYKNAGNIDGISAFSNGDGKVTLGNDVVGAGYTIGDGSLFQNYLDSGGIPGSTTFSVGIDVNDTGVAQTLESFWFLNLTQQVVLASFTGGATGNLENANNGTGFPDYTLNGFDLSLGDIAIGDTIIFLARLSGLNDGPDSFFLQATPNPNVVPIPAALPLLATAMGGLFLLSRRQRTPAV